MSNVEKMEKQIDVLNQEIEMLIENASSENSYDFVTLTSIRDFMRMSLESLKDLHEENCKIWKAIAELQIGEMQKFHDKIYENNLDNRKELNTDDKDNQKD